MVKCVVLGCENRSHTKKEIDFFEFPLNKPRLLNQWLTVIDRKDWRPKPSSRICSEHFTRDAYNRCLKLSSLRLKTNAVPSIFPNVSYLNQNGKQLNPGGENASTFESVKTDNEGKKRSMQTDQISKSVVNKPHKMLLSDEVNVPSSSFELLNDNVDSKHDVSVGKKAFASVKSNLINPSISDKSSTSFTPQRKSNNVVKMVDHIISSQLKSLEKIKSNDKNTEGIKGGNKDVLPQCNSNVDKKASIENMFSVGTMEDSKIKALRKVLVAIAENIESQSSSENNLPVSEKILNSIGFLLESKKKESQRENIQTSESINESVKKIEIGNVEDVKENPHASFSSKVPKNSFENDEKEIYEEFIHFLRTGALKEKSEKETVRDLIKNKIVDTIKREGLIIDKIKDKKLNVLITLPRIEPHEINLRKKQNKLTNQETDLNMCIETNGNSLSSSKDSNQKQDTTSQVDFNADNNGGDCDVPPTAEIVSENSKLINKSCIPLDSDDIQKNNLEGGECSESRENVSSTFSHDHTYISHSSHKLQTDGPTKHLTVSHILFEKKVLKKINEYKVIIKKLNEIIRKLKAKIKSLKNKLRALKYAKKNKVIISHFRKMKSKKVPHIVLASTEILKETIELSLNSTISERNRSSVEENSTEESEDECSSPERYFCEPANSVFLNK